MIVRSAQTDDLAAIGAIHVRSWQQAYRGEMPDSYLDELKANERSEYWGVVLERTEEFGSQLLVIESDREVVGFGCFGPAMSESGFGEIYAMNLDPSVWRTGVGSILLVEIQKQLEQMNFTEAILWTSTNNARAQSFYVTLGWKVDGQEREEQVQGVTVSEIRFAKSFP